MFYESTDKQCRSGAVFRSSLVLATMLAVSEYLGKYGKEGKETVFGPSNTF